jgi:hypothetical protein
MADTVTTNIVFGGASTRLRKYIVHLTCISDGTGESAVAKVTKANLLDVNGNAPTNLKISSIRWNTQGFTYIKLAWDHTAPDTAMVLNYNGYDNFESFGFLRDPASAGGTGNLTLTSVGAVNTASYDITLELVVS